MFVIIKTDENRASWGNTLDAAIADWIEDYDYPPDLARCIIVQGKRKKAEIVLTDYPEPKKPAKTAAK